MSRKIVTFSLFLTFLTGAIYLCPCKMTPAANGIHSQEVPMDCCKRMPNCPLKKAQRQGGIQSLLPSFFAEKISHSFYQIFQIRPISRFEKWRDLLEMNYHSAAPPRDSFNHTLSPQDLFLKHASLLI